ARYREIAAFSPPAARDWPLWVAIFSGPYVACAASALATRSSSKALIASACASLLLGSLAVWERFMPVSQAQLDPAENAGMRLFLVAGLQYLASVPLAFASAVVAWGSPWVTTDSSSGLKP